MSDRVYFLGDGLERRRTYAYPCGYWISKEILGLGTQDEPRLVYIVHPGRVTESRPESKVTYSKVGSRNRSQDINIDYLDVFLGFLLIHPCVLYSMDHVQPLHSAAKDGMFVIPGQSQHDLRCTSRSNAYSQGVFSVVIKN